VGGVGGAGGDKVVQVVVLAMQVVVWVVQEVMRVVQMVEWAMQVVVWVVQ
jgi:hypothetical protein